MAKGLKKWLEYGGIKKIEFDRPKKDVPESGYDGFLLMMAAIVGVFALVAIIAVLINGK